MAKYLATFSDTIDEIEINGFVIMTDKEVETYEEMASSIAWPFVYNVGEDELEFTSGEDLLTRIEFKEISTEEAKMMKRLFNNEFGVFIDEGFLAEVIGEEDDDDDEFEDDYDDEFEDDDELDDNY
jgi:hypothetical protein